MGLLLHYQPYPLFALLADTFTAITSSSAAMMTWLKEMLDESRLSNMRISSLESLALILSALFSRALSIASDDDELSLTVEAFRALTKVQPDIVSQCNCVCTLKSLYQLAPTVSISVATVS